MRFIKLKLIDKGEFWKWMKSRYCYSLDVIKEANPNVDIIIDELNLKIAEINRLNNALEESISKDSNIKRFLDYE